MNTTDAVNLLTVIAQYDPTMMPATDEAIAIKAGVWAKALREIDYPTAVVAVHQHYRHAHTSITVAVIYQAAKGTRTPSGEHYFNVCNPIIVTPTGDFDGRYEVWCRRCGWSVSTYADTIDEAVSIRDTHQYDPAPLRRTPDTESAFDWSEPHHQ